MKTLDDQVSEGRVCLDCSGPVEAELGEPTGVPRYCLSCGGDPSTGGATKIEEE